MSEFNKRRLFHWTLLSVLLATLVVTAGCSGILSDSDSTPEATSTASSTISPSDSGSGNESTAVNATDLRNITIPENGSITVSGELDKSDPVCNNTFYEPVAVTVEAGTHVNHDADRRWCP